MNKPYWDDTLKYVLPLIFLLFLSGCKTVSEDISSEYYNIGNAYYDVGNYDKAIEYYNRALVDGSLNENKIRYNLAVAYSESGRVKEGLYNFEFLLAQDPQNLKVLESVAYAYFLIDEKEKSLEVYDQILEIFEFNKTALFNKALILVDDNKEEAETLLKKLYTIDSTVPVVLLLGKLYRDRDDWASAIKLYEVSLIKDEKNIEMLNALTEYYLYAEQYDKVLLYLDKLILYDKKENLSDYYFRKAEVELLNMKDFDSGLKSLKDAVDNGFTTQFKIKALLEDEQLENLADVEGYLKSQGLLQ